jgi:hypothetical protein
MVSPSEFQGLYLIVFFASATAFISGIVLLFAVAVKAVFSSLNALTGKVGLGTGKVTRC